MTPYGLPGAIVARLPEHENIIPRRIFRCRAAQVVLKRINTPAFLFNR